MTDIRDLALRQLQFEFTSPEPKTPSEPSSTVALDSYFPVEEADLLARLEAFNKHLFRPNTYLHKWWARRSGTTFRYLLKQLCDDPDRRDYYAIGGLEGKTILDPMMGGGTIIHEAIRLGARVIGYDIDPIPVLQAKASLTQIPLWEKLDIFKQFYKQLAERLRPFFATSCPICNAESETQFVLYGLRKKCQCGEALFVDSLLLREEIDDATIELDPYTGIPYRGKQGVRPSEARRLIYEKSVRYCPNCESPFKELLNERYTDRYVPIIVVGSCRAHKQFFKRPDAHDLRRLDEARQFAHANVHLPVEDLGVPSGPKSNDLLNKGIVNFADVFTPRQQIYIRICKDLLDAVDERHRLWLGLLISTSLEFNCLLCGYKGSDKRRAGAIRHVFSHHAYSFPYTALENNPVFSGNTSGTIGLLFQDRIRNAALWAKAPIERRLSNGQWKKVTLLGELDGGTPVESFAELQISRQGFLVAQQDSSVLPLPDDSIDHIVTDPPYYDSVQYSDLAHFFHAWLRWLLPGEANWKYAVTDSAVAETSQDGLKYQKVLSAIWKECHRVLKKPSGRLVFTFHHWRPEAWIHLTLSLKSAGFHLVNHYTIYSENPISVHIRQLRALKHDSILVLRPKGPDGKPVQYPRLEHIDTSDSFTFCSGCAGLLGYCLNTDVNEEEIIHLWQRALGA